MGNYAMIAESEIKVFNTIVADDGFSLDGYYFIPIQPGVFCQAGMYYNEADDLFYDDDAFTTINGIVV